jgi:PKHD-type hydroxylase
MLLHVENVLDASQVAAISARLDAAPWVDGRQTAGPQSAAVKNNLQLDEGSAEARALGQMVVSALERHPIFISAALPRHIFPPLFNRYGEGMGFGTHIDNAIRWIPGTPHRIRTDLSATLFLSAPDSYDGGELVVQDTYGQHAVKLAPGDMVLYPASSLHHVEPVTRGVRTAAFFWVQSMVRSDADRDLLFQLDTAIRELGRDTPDSASLVGLTGCYHNLIRRWAEV